MFSEENPHDLTQQMEGKETDTQLGINQTPSEARKSRYMYFQAICAH